MRQFGSLFCFFILISLSSIKGQDTLFFSKQGFKTATGADPKFIKTFTLPNDVRLILGGQGAAIGFQSTHDKSLKLDLAAYNNVSDLIGFGLTYKVIDFDLLTSLNSAYVLPDGRQNLFQFKLSTSYTARKTSFRLYLSESKGMISTDPQINYKSSADIELLKVGAQITHIFNSQRYSYRAANFQSEVQSKTQGSFIMRFEPFYRRLGMRSSSITDSVRNVEEVYENQTGLHYLSTPGLVVMPGYALNLVIKEGKFYTCPMILLGPGVSLNNYEGEIGKYSSVNVEANGVLMMNTGYNGTRMYVNLRASADLCYSYLDPALFSTNEIKIYLTLGYRFKNLEKKIPDSFL